MGIAIAYNWVRREMGAMTAASRWALLVAVLVATAGCRGPMPPGVRGAPWAEANRLFNDDPVWGGGDGAYTVDLGNDRVLWLFGDSVIRANPAWGGERLIRNSVAVQTGRDPTRAFMRFYWGTDEGGPTSFVPERGGTFFWPGSGVRLGDRLLLLYGRLYQKDNGRLGFRYIDWAPVFVENPDDEPSVWRTTSAQVPPDEHDVDLGQSALIDGDKLYIYGTSVNRSPTQVYLARFALARVTAGDLSTPEWWTGDGWGDRAGRTPIVDFGASELSVQFAPALGLYVMVQTAGVAAATLAIRTAPRLEGPWSDLRDVLRPPESFDNTSIIYAAKGHAELVGADIVATYVPNSFDTVPKPLDDIYYHPFFARLTFP